MAVPSSPSPAMFGSTSTAGSSPAACEAASESTPSLKAHSFVPTPVTFVVSRAVSAAWARTPSDVVASSAVTISPRSSLLSVRPP